MLRVSRELEELESKVGAFVGWTEMLDGAGGGWL